MIGGKYAGRKGWKHKQKGETDSQIYLVLQAVEQDGVVVKPEKVVRIDKKNYQPFMKAINPAMIVIEQKPRLQKKINDLVKELVKLDLKPSEEMLVIIGHQWLQMWEKKDAQTSVDYTRTVSPPPAVSDDEEDDDNEEDNMN